MILLLSHAGDPMVELVAARLKARGARFVHVDNQPFPTETRVSVRFAPGGGIRHSIRSKGETVPVSEIQTAWDHRPLKPMPAEELPAMSKRFATAECTEFVNDFWRSLPCRWMPAHKDVVLRAQYKGSQLKTAQSVGFAIPPTLITNDPREFREFYRRHGGRIISKPFYRNRHEGEGGSFLSMTQIVSNREVGYASSIRYAPVIFQGYVEKRVELRVTVAGGKVLTAAIHSQEGSHRTRHDCRHADLAHTRYEPYQLPGEMEGRCLSLVERLGLCFGAIDLVVTPAGEYVFLEINPSGQWRWIEQMTGLPIAGAIADLLMSG